MKQNKSKLSLIPGKVWLFALFLFACSLISESANAQHCDLVVNGSFDQEIGCPQSTFTSDYRCKAVPPIGGAGYAIVTNAAQWNGPWYGLDEFPGSHFLIVDGGIGANGGTRIWIQNVEVVAGRTYTFYVSAKNIANPFSGAGQDRENPTISLRVNGTTIVTSDPLVQAQTSSAWTQVSGTYTATTTGTVSIDVTQNLKNGYNDVGIDNIRFEYDKPTATVSSASVCAGKSVTLTASGAVNGEAYEWYTSSTRQDLVYTGNPFVTPVLDATMLYWVTIKSPGTCSLNRIPAYANVSGVSTPGPVADQTTCQGKSVVLTGNGAAAGEVYEWYTSETAVSPIFASANPVTTVLLQADVTYWLGIRNASGCKSSRVPAKIFVNPTPAVPVTTESFTLCTGNQLILSASGATNDEVYDWYSTPNGPSLISTGSTFNTPVLYSSIAYYVAARNSFGCSSARKKITITVNPIPSAPATSSNQSICGSGSVTLTAAGSGIINWYNDATSATPLFSGATFTTPVLETTTTYWVSNTSTSLCESARVQVKVTVNPAAITPVVANVSLCGAGSTTLVATSGGPVVTWYDVATGGTVLAYGANFTTPVLSANKSYWVSASTAQGCASTRVQVNVTVNAKPAAPVTTNASRCGCGTVVLTASGSTGQYNWYNTPNGGPALFTGSSITPYSCSNKNYHVTAVTPEGCESSRVISSITITSTEADVNLVTNGDFAAPHTCPPSGFTSDYQCVAAAPVPAFGSNYIAVTNNPAPWNRNYWWATDHSASPSNFLIADGTGGRVWIQTVNVVAGQKYTFSIWARNIVNPNSGVSPDNNPPVVSIRVNNTVIATSAPLQQSAPTVWTQLSGVYTATATGPVSLNVFQTTVNSFNDIAIDDISFIKVGPTASVQDVTICAHHSAALTASGATGSTTYSWYTAETGGTKLFTGNPFVTPVLTETTTYWVSLHEAAGCQSKRVPATVFVKGINLVSNGNFAAANSCPQNNFSSDYQCLTAAPVPQLGNNYIAVTNNPGPWNRNYWWGTDHSSTPSNFLIADGASGRIWMQTVNVVAGQKYTFSIWARNLVNPSTAGVETTLPTVSIRVNTTVLATSIPLPQVAANVWTQVSAVYTATTTGPVTLNVFENVNNQSFNDVGIDDISFIGIDAAPIVSPVTLCGNASAALTASGASGTLNYFWYANNTIGTNPLFIGNPFVTPVLTSTTNYWVALKETGGCESKRVPVVVTVSAKPVITSTTNANRCDCGTLTLTADGDAGTYNWYANATSNIVLGTGKTFVTPSICITREYYVSITNAEGCVSDRVRVEASVNCAATLQFDAIDDKVTIPHNNAYNIGSGNFTIEAMINVPAGTLGRRPILSKRTSGVDGVLLYCSSDRLLLQMSGVPNYQSSFYPNIFDGRCHHIAVTRSGNFILFYVDGVQVGGDLSTRSLNSSGPLYIGHDAVDRSHWNGGINEVRFWNVARTQTELTANVNALSTTNGLIGLWNFNETGQVVLDSSPIANHAVLGADNTIESSDPTRTLIDCNSAVREGDLEQEMTYSETTILNLAAAPNPFTGQTVISVKGLSSSNVNYHVEVYNMQGLMTLSKEMNSSEELILGEDLSAGMYLVKVIENGISQTIKIIKE